MKKVGIVLSAALVGAAIVGGSVMAFNANANESDNINVVSQEEDLYGDYENRFDMEIETMNNMVPVFTAIGARMDAENTEYASSDEFVANAMGYLTYYSRGMLEGKYVEDAENIYVDEDIFEELAKTAFYKYDIKENKALTYNENTKSYTIKKDELSKNYKAEVVSVVNIDGCKDGENYNTYEVVVKIKKGLFTNVEMKFTVEDNEYVSVVDNYMYQYAVSGVEICE